MGSTLSLPFTARRAAPGEPVVPSRRLSGDDDMMPHQVARHATRAEYPEYRGGTRAFCLRVAPRIGLADLARLGRIQPCHALEHHLVVRRREATAEVSAERNDLGLGR